MSSVSKVERELALRRNVRLSPDPGRAMKALVRWTGAPTISVLTIGAILLHLILRYALGTTRTIYLAPLIAVLIFGGIPLVVTLTKKVFAREFGSDLLAGISIITAVLLGEYLVGAIVVLMLSGGTALEEFASRRASSVLDALAKRIPQTAHRKTRA
ncbi:MAG: hypothetical protein WBE21_10725, partial [Candidatus Acidiferrales bacterium]